MNIFLRIVPFFIGVGMTFLAVTSISHFDKPIKLLLVTTFLCGLSYFFVWYNVAMMKRDGTLSDNQILSPNKFGHILIPAGALAGGVGFILNSYVLLGLAFICFWFADDLLTKTRTKQAGLPPSTNPDVDPATIALLNAIAERRKADPFVGAKLGGKEVFQRVLQALRDERGVHTDPYSVRWEHLLATHARQACALNHLQTANKKPLPL